MEAVEFSGPKNTDNRARLSAALALPTSAVDEAPGSKASGKNRLDGLFSHPIEGALRQLAGACFSRLNLLRFALSALAGWYQARGRRTLARRTETRERSSCIGVIVGACERIQEEMNRFIATDGELGLLSRSGSLRFDLSCNLSRPQTINLDLIHIAAQRRRQGLSTKVIGKFCSLCDESGVEILLTARPEQLKAHEPTIEETSLIAFYETFGFSLFDDPQASHSLRMRRSPQ